MKDVFNKKIKLNNNNNQYINNTTTNNNNIDILLHEKLFWRVWRFSLLKNHIISFIKSSLYKYKIYKYDEIYSVPWMVNNNYLGLLKDKVLNKEYLVFSDQLYYEEEEESLSGSNVYINDFSSGIGNNGYGFYNENNIDYNGIGMNVLDYRYCKNKKKTFFNLIKNDKEFYYSLFKNYKELFLTNYEFTFNLLLKYDCLVGFIVLNDIYNSINNKNSSNNNNNNNNINNHHLNNSYSKSFIESINYTSFNIANYLINNYKLNISGGELWKLVLLDSSETVISKVKFIKSYLPNNISNITNIVNFSLDIKWYKKKLRVLLDSCYLIDSIKDQLEFYFQKSNLHSIEDFKKSLLTKDQLDNLRFTCEELEIPVYQFSSLNLYIKSLYEMVVPFTNKITIKKKNFQFLILKYTNIQVEDHSLAKLLRVSELDLETLSKFAILPQQHHSMDLIPNLFKYVKNDKEKKVKYIKIYIKRVLNHIERINQHNQHNQQNQPNQVIFQNLLYIKDRDLFDIIMNLQNSFISLKRLFEISVCKDILYYFKIYYKNDYNLSLKIFLDREFNEIRDGGLKLESFQFILENYQDFEIILSSLTGCNQLLNKIETKNMKLKQFKLFILHSTIEFKFNLEEFYPIQLFKEKYYDAYFWLKENHDQNQFNRIISTLTSPQSQLQPQQPNKVNLLLNYYLNSDFKLPSDKQLFDDNIILKIGESAGQYNLNILDKIIKYYYGDIQQNQQQSSMGKYENELIYKILQVSSKVGNLESFKFIYNNYPILFQNSLFDNASKLYVNNCYYNGHNQVLDFFFNLGLRKYHSSIIETKYNTITIILLNNNIKKSLFK